MQGYLEYLKTSQTNVEILAQHTRYEMRDLVRVMDERQKNLEFMILDLKASVYRRNASDAKLLNAKHAVISEVLMDRKAREIEQEITSNDSLY